MFQARISNFAYLIEPVCTPPSVAPVADCRRCYHFRMLDAATGRPALPQLSGSQWDMLALAAVSLQAAWFAYVDTLEAARVQLIEHYRL